MAYHQRPDLGFAGLADTAEEFRDAWFDPITAAKLNYLVDNLNYLRAPTGRLSIASTPGTVSASVFPAVTDIVSGTYDDYSGGNVYVNVSAQIQHAIGGGAVAGFRVKLAVLLGGTPTDLYIITNTNGGIGNISQPNLFAPKARGATYFQYGHIAILGNEIADFGSSITVTAQIVASAAGTVNAKNVRVDLREL